MARVEMTSIDGCADGSAASGDTLYQLGMICASGRSGAVDLVSAHKWFNLAAHRGLREAAERRRELADTMSAAEIAEAQRLAREWITRH